MPDMLTLASMSLLAVGLLDILASLWPYILIILGFSAVIFVHELGHYALAKWADVRVEKFCIGFGRELFGFTKGETRYGFNILPLGGYVKMLGQEDFDVDGSGAIAAKTEDPRSFANKSVAARMAIVSGGVIMNVIFAAFLFMIVFMIGLEVMVTEVGFIEPNSPAALGGVQVGDTIVRINGEEINEFSELNMAIMLADPHEPMNFEVRRDGQIKHLKIQPENREEKGHLMVGLGPAMTNQVMQGPPAAAADREDLPRRGDTIVEVNGEPVTKENANEVYMSLVNNPASHPEVIVERPINPESEDSEKVRVRVRVTPTLRLHPSDPRSLDLINVLGFAPLMRVDAVEPGGPAEEAGVKVGDTVLRIGDVEYPTRAQIARTIRDACLVRKGPEEDDYDFAEADIPLVVSRRGTEEPLEMTLRPKVRSRLFKRNGYPQPGFSFDLIANDLLRVGPIVKEIGDEPSPAALSGIPAGALIQRVNDVRVEGWIDLIEQLRTNAGSTVSLAYSDPDGESTVAEMAVPRSVRTILGIPVSSRILSIDGKESVDVELGDKIRSVSVLHWFGLKTLLSEHVGETVRVKYTDGPLGNVHTADLAVTEDMVDPWVGRIGYAPNFIPYQATKLLRTPNPLKAVAIGVKKTGYFILNVYTTMKRMIFTRTVGVEHLSGPVGIVEIGRNMASVGLNQLLYFLAIISANLAVINFLPLPIVDGGLMVFLIIEKIKGSPVSVKTQVATQVLGLVLIIAAFLYVTIQDLQRIFG